MRLMSSTWRTIVSVHWSKISRSCVISLPYLRFSRSAESWIGVSGFLISWAMRRATSAQAEVRCAVTRSVMSSSVTTKFGWPSAARRAEVTRTLKVRSATPRLIVIWLCTARGKSSSASVKQRRDLGHDLGDIGADASPDPWRRSSDSSSAERLSTVTIPSESTPMTAAGTPESTASVNSRRSSLRRLAASSRRCCRLSSVVILLKTSPSRARSPCERSTSPARRDCRRRPGRSRRSACESG